VTNRGFSPRKSKPSPLAAEASRRASSPSFPTFVRSSPNNHGGPPPPSILVASVSLFLRAHGTFLQYSAETVSPSSPPPFFSSRKDRSLPRSAEGRPFSPSDGEREGFALRWTVCRPFHTLPIDEGAGFLEIVDFFPPTATRI